MKESKMTKVNESWEEQQVRCASEKERRKRQAELDELALLTYMAGNMGSALRMEAAAMAAHG
jgi:hypothetical protein